MKIIKATKKHIPKIISLIDAIYQEYGYRVNTNKYDRDLLDIEKFYFQKKGQFWILVNKKEIIGTIAIKPENNTIIIKRFYLHKKFRGTGLADKLFAKAIKYAKKQGYEKIILFSDTKFKRAHNFYKKKNFNCIAVIKKNDADIPYSECLFYSKI